MDKTACEQRFDFWVDAVSEFITMLMRGTDRCNGVEPVRYRPGFTLMWALIENVFYGDERAEVIAEVAEAFADELANRLDATDPPEHFRAPAPPGSHALRGPVPVSRWALGDVRNPLI